MKWLNLQVKEVDIGKGKSLIIPRRSRLHQLLNKGNTEFIEIKVKDTNDIMEFIEIIENDVSSKIAYLQLKKGYNELYDCFDESNTQMRDIFACKICHDIIKMSGGNAARHALQHTKQNHDEKKGLYQKIRLFIYKTAQPFPIIEEESFRDLFAYKLRSIELLQKNMKSDYIRLVKEIQKQIQKSTSVCLILDEWSHFNNSYLGITAFLTGNMEYDSIVLALSVPDEYDRTVSTISHELSNQINNYLLDDKIVGATTDCAVVMKKSINILKIPWSPCVAHIIHNAIKKMLDKCDQFNIAMSHANELANDFRFKQYIGSHMKMKKNMQTFNDTRWLSRANTCKDIVDLYEIMKEFETSINLLINVRNEETQQKVNKYICPITCEDYNICLTLNPMLQKLKRLILILERRSHDGFFIAFKKYILTVSKLRKN